MGPPRGIAERPQTVLVTSANDKYNARIPHTRPSHPPSLCHVVPIPRSPAASRKNAIHRVRNMSQSMMFNRKVGIHIKKVKTPHIKSVIPSPLGCGGLIQPAPIVQSKSAYHHQM